MTFGRQLKVKKVKHHELNLRKYLQTTSWHCMIKPKKDFDEETLRNFCNKGERFMRLDKYLKVSRLVKRRTLAKEISDQGRITINGNVAKAGTDVKVEDELVIRFGQKLVTVKVTGLSEHASKENAKGMYDLIKEERINQNQFEEE